MSKGYKPRTPFNVPMKILTPGYQETLGVRGKKYAEGEVFYGSFRTFGGTDTTVNGVYSVESTATIETWFNPEIKSNCEILVIPTNQVYSVLGEPENIEMRNQFMKLKVTAVKGGT